jgi:hypothetical protein
VSKSSRSRAGLAARELKPIPLAPMPENPLVSVLTANYNYARFVGEAIRSVQRQTYTNWEMIVCDDGSTDNSLEVVESYARCDCRITLLRQKNGGQASALNTAYAASRGEVISLLDADDTWSADKVERTLRSFVGRPTAGFAIHRLQPVSASGRRIDRPFPVVLAEGWVAPRALDRGGLTLDFPWASGLSFRRPVARELFPIPLTFRRSADGYLMQVAQFCSEIVPEASALARYRIHGANIVAAVHISPTVIAKSLEDQENIRAAQRRYLALNHGPGLAEFIRPNPESLAEAALALHLLGTWGDGRLAAGTPSELLGSLPAGARKKVWRLLMALPRPLGRKALDIWWGTSFVKRLLRPMFPRLRTE